MPTITTTTTGLELYYETHGNPEHETMLLVMGLGAQMTLWPEEFVAAMVDRGFHTVLFDNRDIGLSQKMGDARAPGIAWQVLRKRFGWPAPVPYTLKDMADDAAGLLGALEIEKAHVVGASMGGMIAQLMAIHHRHKMHSLTSIMSTTGNPKLPQAEKEAMEVLVAPLPSMEEEDLVAHGMRIRETIGSPGFPGDPEKRRAVVLKNVRRNVYPAGLPRQLAAIIDDGDRRKRLEGVTTPTLVLHGEGDPLVKVEAGRETAKHIPGAKLVTIPGWGHDLPLDLTDTLADEIAAHAKAAKAKSAQNAVLETS
ncbi:alpha/beta fold hydrolase [Erythrobacter sp. YT30]|uniref:alpha/beta fold hydrolase n=1 Tax=Erythrobacter sp. YT30 TaxID=1735012 RepID=UPI00076CE08F|nr:alpha/beta fold hydrolase [Erythrobacter sp. YT30]KWV91613.1 alpha/beta hydrolase [Erythrobacter sp. YT30]